MTVIYRDFSMQKDIIPINLMKENVKIMAFLLLFRDIQVGGAGSMSLCRDVRVK